MEPPTLKMVVAILVCILVLWLLKFFLYDQAPIYSDFNITDYKRFSEIDQIKTGDLFITRHTETNIIYASVYGSRFTHVGMFHRCSKTNRLFVFDVMNGMHYLLWEDMIKLYKGHAFIRRLRKPLSSHQLHLFQHMIDDLYQNQNTNAEIRHVVSHNERFFGPVSQYVNMNKTTLGETPFELHAETDHLRAVRAMGTCLNRYMLKNENASSDFAIVCTDVIYVLLQQLEIISKNKRSICIKPDVFAFRGDEELDRAYFDTEILKNYFTDPIRKARGNNTVYVNDITYRMV